MGRRHRGLPINGWLVIDKPAGLGSTATVAAVRRATGAAKVGHAGTLDPLATGILPIALGEATKTVPYVVKADKCYRFTVRWGEARTTDDAEGDVTATNELRPTPAEIRAVLEEFVGVILQRPPAYSALKIGGRRAYAIAREDRPVILEPREVCIHEIELTAIPHRDLAEISVRCGKGTYMRSLARDMAERLGTVGHIVKLHRNAVGGFQEQDAISLERLNALVHSAALDEHLLPVETALDDIPALALTETEAARLRCGCAIQVLRSPDRVRIGELGDGAIVFVTSGGKPVALTRVDGAQLRPVRVLNI